MARTDRSRRGRTAYAVLCLVALALAAMAPVQGKPADDGAPAPDPIAALAARSPDDAGGGSTYEVVSGDTLWAIAARFLGDGSRWREIFEANRDQIGNPNLIYPGQRFRIPGGKGPQAPDGEPERSGDGRGKAGSGGRGPDANGRNVAFQKMPIAHGSISSDFGPRPSPCPGCSSFHRGIDIPAPRGTPVYSTGPGRVVAAYAENGGGNTIIIDHGNGYKTAYLHLKEGSFRVGVGDRVDAGQQIAGVNSTGQFTTGDHLHFAVMKDGEYIDPQRCIHIPQRF